MLLFFYFRLASNTCLCHIWLLVINNDKHIGSTTFQVIQTSDTNKLVRGLEILKRLQKH